MKIDVRTKVLLVCLANLVFLFRVTGWLELVMIVVLAVLLALSGRPGLALGQVLFFGFCLVADSLYLAFWPADWLPLPITMVRACRLMMPAILAGTLLLTTSTAYELIHGLRKWHLPESLLLTFALMLRFLPTIGQDAKSIRQSLRLRGLFISPWDLVRHPLRFGEYLLVPLLMALLRRAETLTMALMTKGLVLDGKASQTFASGFSWLDWSVCLWIVGMMTWLLM